MPVVVSKRPIFGINCPGKDSFGTLLDAPEAALAGIEILRFIHGTPMAIILIENAVHAVFLNALSATTGAIFPKFNRRVLADRIESRWC